MTLVLSRSTSASRWSLLTGILHGHERNAYVRYTNDSIVPFRVEYRALLTSLYSQLHHGPISLMDFSQDHDISLQAARRLARESNDMIQENGTERQRSYMTRSCSGPEEWIYTFDYARRLTDEVTAALESATM